MDDLYTRFDQTFFERTRLSIVTLIEQRRSVSFTALKTVLGATDGALFSHLSKLVDAGYITRRREVAGESVRTVYSLSEKGSTAYHEYLTFLHDLLERQKGANE